MDEFRRNKRLAPHPMMITDEGDELTFEPEAPAAWAEPERVVADEETVQLVWDATAGLNPDDHALLDLHLRKGLEPAEIAAVVGSTPGVVYTRLTRLRDALEASVTALLLYRRRRHCDELDSLIARYAEAELTPKLRKAINRHLDDCADCQQSRKGFLTAGALFSAVPLFIAPSQAHAAALSLALGQGAGDAGAQGPSSPSGAPGTAATWVKALVSTVAAAGFVAGGWIAGSLMQEPSVTVQVPDAYATAFRLSDSASGSAVVARSLGLALEARTTGQVSGWIVTEDSHPVLTPEDSRWTGALPEHFQLSSGDGPRTVFLWAKDEVGGVSVSSASIMVDTTPPPAPLDLASTSHMPGQAARSNQVTVTWSAVIDPAPGSGLSGYMAAWDTSGDHQPSGVTLGPDAQEATSAALPPGEWWFIIRAIDQAGNTGPIARIGPFIITAPAPPAEAVRTPVESVAPAQPRQEAVPVAPTTPPTRP